MYMQGEMIAVKLPSGVEHYGLATGYGTVISASKRVGLVIEECFETFSSGYPVLSKGYPSDLDPVTVMMNARALIGRKWDLFFDNCQHFATECHNDRRSPQLQAAIFFGVVLFVGFLWLRSK